MKDTDCLSKMLKDCGNFAEEAKTKLLQLKYV